MTTQELIVKMEEYFNHEYNQTKRILSNPPRWLTNPLETKSSTLQRCLGITFFAQELGVPFDEIESRYYELREKVEKL